MESLILRMISRERKVDMDIDNIEKQLKFTFPDGHRKAIINLEDPIHKACDFYLPSSTDNMNSITEINEFLHNSSSCDLWPEFLIAFASQGCGDYCAYDTRTTPPRIIHMDPDLSVDENLNDSDSMWFSDFNSWYQAVLEEEDY